MEFIETKDKVKVIYEGKELAKFRNSSRLVFFHTDFVVKIDHNPSSKRGNQCAREIEFWERLTEDEEYFAELLSYGRTPKGLYWLKQKRYPIVKTVRPDIVTLVDNLCDKYGLLDIWTDTRITAFSNFTVFKNTPKIYDFAY